MDGDADGGEIFCFGVQEVAGVNGCLSAMGKDVFFVFIPKVNAVAARCRHLQKK